MRWAEWDSLPEWTGARPSWASPVAASLATNLDYSSRSIGSTGKRSHSTPAQ